MFRYRALNSDGELVEGESIQANEAQVAVELQRLNYTPVKIIPIGRARPRRRLGRRRKHFDRLQFFENLSDYLDSGLPIDKALELESLGEGGDGEGGFIAGLLEQVRQGQPISEAMAEYPGRFTSLDAGIVQAGEQSDSLRESLQLLARLAGDLQTIRDKLRSALVYPAILTGVMLISIVILFGVVIPRFKSLFVGMGLQLEGITAVIIGMSDFLSSYYQVLLLLLALGIIGGKALLARLRDNRAWMRFLLAVPLIGAMIRSYNLYLFSVVMQILTEKRITIITALGYVGDAIGNRIYKAEIEMMKREISRGHALGEVIDSTLFGQHYVYLIGVGEQTGRMAETFRKLSGYYYKQLDLRIKAIVTYAEPIIIMLLGVVVGVIVVSMLQAIMSVNELAL